MWARGMVRLGVWLWCVLLAAPAISATFLLQQTSSVSLQDPTALLLSADGRLLFVANTGQDVVSVLDAANLFVLGEIGRGQLKAPQGLALDREGRLLVADSGNDRVVRFRLTGPFGLPDAFFQGGLQRPQGVLGLDDGRVLVANTGANALAVFHGDGRRENDAAAGAIPGQYSAPQQLLAAGNRVVVVDSGNRRLVFLDSRLNWVATPAPVPALEKPLGVAFDGSAVVVADADAQLVRRYELATFRHLDTLGDVFSTFPQVSLTQPAAVAARQRSIWVADRGANRVQRFEVR